MAHELELSHWDVATIGDRRQGKAREPFTQVGSFIKAVKNHWMGKVIFERNCSIYPRPTQGHLQLSEELLRPDPVTFHAFCAGSTCPYSF